MFKSVLLVSFSLAVILPAFGNDITLHNTGEGLGNGAVDPNYQLTSAPTLSGVGPASYVVDSSLWPISSGDWMPDSASSAWIGPVADERGYSNSTGSGNYLYEASFDLSGLNPNTATITGRWTTDNYGLDILINGVSTGFTHYDQGSTPCYAYYTDFTISSGFVAGVNKLDFVVFNRDLGFDPSINPTGLRVEMTGTAAAVPEPVSGIAFVIGLMGVSRRARNRKQ